MGRYTRVKTLPALAREGRGGRIVKTATVLLIDPDSDDTCRAYAKYRRGLGDVTDQWTDQYVRSEVIATILSVAALSATESQLKLELYLKPVFSKFRIDLGNDAALVTQEGRDSPALSFTSGSHFYTSFRDEIYRLAEQSRQVELTATENPVSIEEMEPDGAIRILRAMKIQCTDELAKEALSLAREARNPYE